MSHVTNVTTSHQKKYHAQSHLDWQRFAYIYIYILHIHTYVYMYVYLNIRIHMCMHIRTSLYICIGIHVQSVCKFPHWQVWFAQETFVFGLGSSAELCFSKFSFVFCESVKFVTVCRAREQKRRGNLYSLHIFHPVP